MGSCQYHIQNLLDAACTIVDRHLDVAIVVVSTITITIADVVVKPRQLMRTRLDTDPLHHNQLVASDDHLNR